MESSSEGAEELTLDSTNIILGSTPERAVLQHSYKRAWKNSLRVLLTPKNKCVCVCVCVCARARACIWILLGHPHPLLHTHSAIDAKVYVRVCVCMFVENEPQISLQHAATHCNTLQCTATHCNTLQHNYGLCVILRYLVCFKEAARTLKSPQTSHVAYMIGPRHIYE